ncbi:MAG: Crp/Fnr family transcriptional regulator [Hungatella sp.]|nr:Crp/Fnr family transcriptional regulator [Hungatella sp.]
MKDLIRSCSTEIQIPKGQIIHVAGTTDSSVYYIAKGSVRFVCNSMDGNEKILYILGEGHFFNEEILFTPHEIAMDAVCNEACCLWKIDSYVHGELLKNQEFLREICQEGIRKKELLQKEIADISFMSCKQRILQILAGECDRKHVCQGHWYEVKRSYTHQELASMIGANRVTVTKLIAELYEEGKLRRVRRRVQVHRSVADGGE